MILVTRDIFLISCSRKQFWLVSEFDSISISISTMNLLRGLVKYFTPWIRRTIDFTATTKMQYFFSQGGVQSNVVPEKLTAVFDIRLAVTVDHAQFESMVCIIIYCTLCIRILPDLQIIIFTLFLNQLKNHIFIKFSD